MTFGGLWFGVLGFLLVTDYKGGRRWLIARTQLPGPLDRLILRFFFGGDQERKEQHEHRTNREVSLFLGWLFLLIGVALLLIVVVGGLVLFVKSLL